MNQSKYHKRRRHSQELIRLTFNVKLVVHGKHLDKARQMSFSDISRSKLSHNLLGYSTRLFSGAGPKIVDWPCNGWHARFMFGKSQI